jgi:esterase/lipase superfamily enzyme
MQGSNLAALSSQLVPGVPVCIFVHGSFVQWESQCREAHSLYVRMRSASSAPLQMIFFTWPSDGPYTYLFPIDAAVRARQADFNGFHLAYLLSQIPESCPVSLIGHSHGTRVVLATMHMAGGGTVEGFGFPYAMGARRYRVILAAAAMDHNWLNPGQPFGCALNRVECLLNLRNRHDVPLAFQPLSRPFAHRALARAGFTSHDTSRLGYNAAKIRECDVTHLIGHAHLWPEYYKQGGIIAAMLPYVYFF